MSHKKYFVTYNSFVTPTQVLVEKRKIIFMNGSGTINIEKFKEIGRVKIEKDEKNGYIKKFRTK